MARSVSRRTATWSGPSSIPVHFVWVLWWTKCTGTGFRPSTYVLPLSVQFHQPSLLTLISILPLQKDKREKPCSLQTKQCSVSDIGADLDIEVISHSCISSTHTHTHTAILRSHTLAQWPNTQLILTSHSCSSQLYLLPCEVTGLVQRPVRPAQLRSPCVLWNLKHTHSTLIASLSCLTAEDIFLQLSLRLSWPGNMKHSVELDKLRLCSHRTI
jgi:hypothetical protein